MFERRIRRPRHGSLLGGDPALGDGQMLSQTGQRVDQLDVGAPRPGDQLASRLELEASAGGRRRSDPFNYIPVSDAEPIAATRLQLLNGVRGSGSSPSTNAPPWIDSSSGSCSKTSLAGVSSWIQPIRFQPG